MEALEKMSVDNAQSYYILPSMMTSSVPHLPTLLGTRVHPELKDSLDQLVPQAILDPLALPVQSAHPDSLYGTKKTLFNPHYP